MEDKKRPQLISKTIQQKKIDAQDLMRKGEQYLQQAAYSDGIVFFEKAISLFEALSDFEHIAKSKIYIGQAYALKGEAAKGLNILQALFPEIRNYYSERHKLFIDVHTAFGLLYGRLGDINKQRVYYKKALDLFLLQTTPNQADLAIAYNNLGVNHSRNHEYGIAQTYFEKSLGIWQQLAGIEDDFTVQKNIGWAYSNLGNCYNHKANEQLIYYQKALEIRKNLYGENHPEVAMSYNGVGGAYNRLEQYNKALPYLEKSVLIAKVALGEEHSFLSQYYVHLSRSYTRLQNFDAAFTCLEKVLAIRKKKFGEKHIETARAFEEIGNSYLGKGDYLAAAKGFHKALIALKFDFNELDIFLFPKFEYCQYLQPTITILSGKATSFLHLYKQYHNTEYLNAAFYTINYSLKLLHQERLKHQNQFSSLAWAHYASGINEYAMNIFYEMQKLDNNQINKCLAYIEQTKSMMLLGAIQETNAKTIITNIPEKWIEQKDNLLTQLNQINKKIWKLEKEQNTTNHKHLGKLKEERFDLQEHYDRLILKIEVTYPTYHQLKYNLQSSSIQQIQTTLPNQSCLLNYFVSVEDIYLFVITANNVRIHKIEKPPSFNQLIKDFNKGLNRTMLQKYAQAAHQLYQILIAPILQYFDCQMSPNHKGVDEFSTSNHSTINQLIIIPHDILSTLPFEALLCSLPKENTSLQYTNLDYLLLHYDVIYHYSATLWWQSQKDKQERQVKVLKESFVGFAPVYQNKREGEVEAIKNEEWAISERGTRSIQIGTKIYNALLYSEKEVKGIQSAFALKHFSHQTFLHEQATKSNFEAAVKGKKYVLIAAHGFYNKKQPELSGIIFSPNESEQSEEAVLYVNDAYHLDLKQADLVVLSACESGIGKLAKGEGMMAVNRGFLYSGAKNVIFTLFKVYDEQSSQLTQGLFRYILEGKKYAQALRLAKLDLIRQSDADPKAWAGFVMIGG